MFEKSSGYVVLVDIDGYTQMKNDHTDTVYLPVLEAFFAGCEVVIEAMKDHAGNGYIIGDGVLLFFRKNDPDQAREVIATDIADRLRRIFHNAAGIHFPGHDYKLSFAAGYCEFHIRRGVDLVGPEIDRLFGMAATAEDETVLMNDRLIELIDTH